MTRSTQLLYDQAETHIFSDWVAPYALDLRVTDLNEYYFGGFPDLSSFLKRTPSRCSLNSKVFKQLTEKKLTKFGRLLRREIKGKAFLDLGCGIPRRSVIPRLFAQAFAAQSYLGVDNQHLQSGTISNEFSELGTFESQFFKMDLLRFLNSYRRVGPVVFFLAGLEPHKNSKAGVKYLKDVRDRIAELTKRGDLIFVGAGTPDLELEEASFKRIYSDPYQEIFKAVR